MTKILALFLSVMVTSPVMGTSYFSEENPETGYFWYKDPKEEKKEEVAPASSPAAASPAQTKEKKPMTVAWLREMLPKLREQAIDNPTEENLAAYFYMQRVEMDKAQRFSKAAKRFVEGDPLLDENNRVPLSTYGKNEFMGKAFRDQQLAMKYLASNVGGLFVFFDSKCDFCKAQIRIVNALKKKHGFVVKFISMDGKGLPGIDEWETDNGHAKMLGLKVFPTTVFAVPPRTYLIVSQGIMAEDQLGERIMTAATTKKLLPEEMERNINPFDRGVLAVEDMQDGASDDPAEVVKYVKEKLKKRY